MFSGVKLKYDRRNILPLPLEHKAEGSQPVNAVLHSRVWISNFKSYMNKDQGSPFFSIALMTTSPNCGITVKPGRHTQKPAS